MSIYVDGFVLISNTMVIFNALKKSLKIKYYIKNLGKVKTIIKQQLTRDIANHKIKINQSIFIRDLVIKKGFINCNVNIILMKAKLTIEMHESNNYNKINIYIY